jgi:hypothetical protein
MKITLMTICGEDDHPLFEKFSEYYRPFVDDIVIELGCTKKWIQVNGQTTSNNVVFLDKVSQQNEALKSVPEDTDYIFTFDIDEFVSEVDINGIKEYLRQAKPDMCCLQMNQFWHQDNYVAYGGDGWGYEAWNPRIFRYEKGMTFLNHRPPTPSYRVTKSVNLPQRGNHYSYCYIEQVYRKLKYYNKVYPHMDYQTWFENVFLQWTPKTKDEIESKWSIHPSVPNAKTRKFTGKHDIVWK